MNVKTICISCDEGWEGPGSHPPPIAVTDAGFARIGKCKKLQKLWLSTIHPLQVTEDCLKSLADLSDLRVFQGGVTPFTDAGITHLAPLENLEELWLDFNTHFTDSCLGTFSQLKKLRVLRFHGAPISDAGIAKIRGLSNLEDLQLGKSQVGDAALAAIGTFSKLRTLDLQQTRVTDDGLQKLKNLQLNWLCLNGTTVTSKGLSAISGMTGMKYLFISDTGADDSSLDFIAGMKNLESCDLSATRVTGAGIRKLAGLARIVHLQLNDLPLTDTDVPLLTEMKALKHVELNHTKITPAGFRKLARAGIERLNIFE